MKNVAYILVMIFLIVSCNDDFVKEYYGDGIIKREYFIRNDKLNGTYREYYPSGNLKVERNYINGKKTNFSKYYFDLENTILESKILWLNDSLTEEVIFSKEGNIKAKGKVSIGEKSNRIGKWIFNGKNKDSVIEYKLFESNAYVNQIWVIDKVKKDTINHLSNYYLLNIQDTINANDILRIRLSLIQPFYNYNSDIEVVLPVDNEQLSFDYSNIREIEKDTFFSLKNDRITQPNIPKWIPQNHVAEFGLVYEKSGTHNIRGILIEYVPDTNNIENSRLERHLFFEKKIYVKPE